jgi:hypothetical protein
MVWWWNGFNRLFGRRNLIDDELVKKIHPTIYDRFFNRSYKLSSTVTLLPYTFKIEYYVYRPIQLQYRILILVENENRMDFVLYYAAASNTNFSLGVGGASLVK